MIAGTPPSVTSTSLPVAGESTNTLLSQFTLNFSETLVAATVTNAANYSLTDNFGNTYALVPASYAGGLSETLAIANGPLQPGSYTLNAGSGITDRAQNDLIPFQLQFGVVQVAGYVTESAHDNTPATATPLGTPTSQADGSFTPSTTESIGGNQPYFTATAALRGAGEPLDLVTANFNSGTISVLLGNGNGTFQAPVTYAVGTNPIAVAIGDLTGTGTLDIAVANFGSNTISVLMGNGDGTFQAPVTYNVGSQPRGVAIANLNGSSNGNDLVVANWNSANVSVLLNNGNGTFASAVSYPVGSNPGNVVVADFNGDGTPDIATANDGSNTVSILPGIGNGTFGSQITYSTGSGTNPIDLVAVKLVSGGMYDLVTANNGNSTVSVLLNQGTPGAAFTANTFAAAVSYAAGGNNPYHLVAGVFGNNGNQDIAVAGYGNNQVGVLLGTGTGTLQAATSYAVGGNPTGITAGVFTGNGLTDLVTANFYGNNVTVLLANSVKSLPVDATTGLASGYGRGALLNTSTADFFSWTGNAGDLVQVVSENPGDPGNTSLLYQIFEADGSTRLTYFYTNTYGEGQSSQITLPYTGTYLVEVSDNNSYAGEYRLRVTESAPTLPFVTTYDGSTSNYNTPTLVNTSPGNLTATMAGYIGQGDSSGDFFSLGNVLAGTTLNLTLKQPSNSLLGGVLNIYNSSGVNLTNNITAGNTLSYTVPAGAGGTYYAGVSSASTTTLSFWMDWNGTNNEVPIGLGGYDLYLDSGYFGLDDNNGDIYGISSAGLANSWHLVTAVFVDGTETLGQLWIDGAQQTLTQKQRTPASGRLVSTDTTIGNVDGGGNAFTGELDEVAYFDGTLTPAQIQAEYAARNSGNYSTTILSQDPVAYYRLGESSGTVAYDSSGNHDNASLSGSITLGVPGAVGNDSNTAYQFNGGSIAAVVPESTGLLGQYLLSIDVANTTSPQITGDTLPVQGTTSSSIINGLTLTFSEDLNPTSANDTANYTLEDSLGNVYHLASPGYTSGTTATYSISDGPLQPGSYTFTVSGLSDRTSNTLVPYSLSFSVVNVAPYTLESRSDNTPATATPLVTPASQADGSFTPSTTESIGGNQPYFTATAALRGAGEPLDLVTANFNSGTISVLLGNGNGTFQAPVTYAVGTNPIAVAIGDLTGTGTLDIAVANFGSNTISVLMGNGDGTFQAPVTYNVGSQPRGVAIANLNGSSNGNDLVVANWNSANVSVLLNNGNGTFASAVSYPVGSNPGNVVVADFNGDGTPDIATANDGSNTVSILPGIGNGTFGSQITYSTGSGTNPIDLVAVKLVSGGMYDLVTANNGNSTVSVLLNQGTPGAAFTANTFAAAVSYAAGGNNPYHLVAGVFGNNGNQDIAVAGYGNNQVGVLLGTGTGTLQAATSYAVGGNPTGITAGVFTGNGLTDLVTANFYGNNVTVLLANSVKSLPVDATTGLASGYGRGALLNTSTADFFSWTGNAGDLVQVVSENPGDPGNTSLLYQIFEADGSTRLTYFYTNTYGEGQSSQITLPYTGTYLVEVSDNNSYAGEYRLRVTESAPTLPFVTTYDGSTSNYNTPTLVNTSPGNLTATMAGYIGQGDSSGDFFSLGNVLAGTTLNLTLKQPSNSLLGGVLNIYNSSGVNLTNNITAGNTLSYTVPAGAGGTYYAGVSSASTTTLSFWMDWNGTNNEVPIGLGGYDLYLDSGYFGLDDNNGDIYGISSAGLANSWHLVTAVFVDGTETLGQLWIDGAQQTLTQKQRTPASGRLVSTDTTIGNVDGGGNAFTGELDEVAYFDGTLTPAQIQAEYAARNSGNYSTTILSQDPVAYYRLGESSGTVAYDSSGNHDNASLSGSITLGVPGAVGNDSNTAYQFNGGSIAAVVPESTGLFGQYLLSIDVVNTASPTITATTLPAPGAASSAIIDQLTLDFTEDMNAASVNKAANYVLVDGSGNSYALSNPAYATGLSATYSITNGPLQPGTYTLTITGLTDRMGNAQNPFSLQFTMASVAGFTNQGRGSDNSATPTALTLTNDPAGTGLFVAGGRGALINNSDIDYWTFSGTSGNSLVVSTQNLNSPANSALEYVVTEPNGSTTLMSFSTANDGDAESVPITLPTTGTYTISVHIYNGYYGEYRFRVSTATPGLQLDQEPNNTIATADALALPTSGNSQVANVAGTILNPSDLNYFNLGTVQAGYSILITSQLSSTSALSPVVSVYNAADVDLNKTNGRPFDGVGQFDITQTGTYYALMQGGSDTGGLLDQYVMNVQIVPTSSLALLTNLEVTNITLPAASNIASGQPITFSWTVTNEGQAPTNVADWSDRAVLSLDTTYGDSTNIPLGTNNGVFAHSGVLAVGASYTATETVTLPDGISGNYYIIVQTDAVDQVDESAIGRGDSITVASGGPNNNGTFTVSLAPYPDLFVQGLTVNGPNAAGNFSVSWDTVNEGNGAVANNWEEQLVVKDITTGVTVVNTPLSFSGGLAANGGTAAHTEPVTGSYAVDSAGQFQVTVTTNSDQSIYVDGPEGHAAAVANEVSTTTFYATRDLQVAGLAVTSSGTPQSGGEVTIGWDDTNTGNLTATGQWDDSVTVINTTTGATLINGAIVPFGGDAIQPGGESAQSYTFTLPGGSSGVGNIKVVVTVNSNNAIAEYNAAGTAQSNNTSALTFTSTVNLLNPDLTVSNLAVQSPAAPQSGNLVTIGWDDENIGTAAVNAAFSDSVLVQQVGTGGAFAYVASGSVTGDSTLAANDAVSPETFSFTLPNGAAGTGSFLITVTTDSGQTVAEFDGSGNPAYYNNTASITLTATLAAYPDLQVTGLAVNPTSPQSGDNVTISWNDANTGTGNVNQSFYDYVQVQNLTTGQTLSTSTVYYNFNTLGNLAAGTSMPRQLVVQLPNGPAGAGDIQITVTTNYYDNVDVGNASNNTAQTTVTSTLAAYPDLQVENLIVSPSSGLQSGDNVTVDWSDANTGNGPVNGAFYDHVVVQNLTTGNTVDTADVYYDPNASGPIAAGGSAARQLDFTLPQGTAGAGQLQVTVTTNYYNQVFEYNTAGPGGTSTAQSNNSASDAFSATLAAYADLAVSNVTAPSLTIGNPAQVTVGWTVTNQGTGTGTVSTWEDAVIASPDDNPADGKTLAEFTHTGLLSVNGSYTQSQTFFLPPKFEGQYHLFVEADAGDVVFENGLRSVSTAEAPNLFDVAPIPYAELEVSAVTIPAAAASGQPMQMSYTVTNQGIGPTNTSSWNDTVLLTSDPAGTDVVANLGTFEHDGVLAVNDSYTHIIDAVLPNGLTGTYYVVVQTGGPYQFIYTADNSAVSPTPVVVTLTPPPDLTPTAVMATLPGSSVILTSATSGSTIDVTWTVQNTGSGAAIGTWVDEVELQEVGASNNPTFDLGNFSFTDSLEPGLSYTRVQQVQLPANLEGVFQLVLITNSTGQIFENGATNNTFTGPNLLTLSVAASPNPDLQVELVTAPSTAQAGGTVAADFTVINQGVAAANGQWTDGVYLSLDDTIDGSSALLGSFSNQSALMPGQSYETMTGDMVIPDRFAGSCYLIVETNSNGAVDEYPAGHDNTYVKCITITPLPPADLDTSNVAVPAQAFDGETITVQYTVSNLGLGPTDVADWTDTIWLSADETIPNTSKGDVLLATLPHDGILGNSSSVITPPQSYTVSTTVTLPEHIKGQYYITAWADSFNEVLKVTLDANINPNDPNQLYSDNYNSAPTKILLTPPADLVVTAVTPQPTAVGGDDYSVSWTVQNQGTSPTEASTLFDQVYLSNNPIYNAHGADQWLLGTVEHDGAVASGGSYSVEQTFELSPEISGQYVIVVTNTGGFDSSGNYDPPTWEGPYPASSLAAPTSVSPLPPADLDVTSVVSQATNYSGEQTSVTWTVTNEGNPVWSGTSYWQDTIYFSPFPSLSDSGSTNEGSFVHSNDQPLLTGQSYTQTATFTLPPGIGGTQADPQTFYVFVITNPGGTTNTGNRDNDLSLDYFSINAYAIAANDEGSGSLPVIYREPDLQVSNLIVPATASYSGSTIPVTWTVTNTGNRDTRTNFWIDRVYLSQSPSLDDNAYLLGSSDHDGILAVGDSYTTTLDVRLPDGVQGPCTSSFSPTRTWSV